ncbi:unnamed protein product [Chrysoparadoxa australica]
MQDTVDVEAWIAGEHSKEVGSLRVKLQGKEEELKGKEEEVQKLVAQLSATETELNTARLEASYAQQPAPPKRVISSWGETQANPCPADSDKTYEVPTRLLRHSKPLRGEEAACRGLLEGLSLTFGDGGQYRWQRQGLGMEEGEVGARAKLAGRMEVNTMAGRMEVNTTARARCAEGNGPAGNVTAAYSTRRPAGPHPAFTPRDSLDWRLEMQVAGESPRCGPHTTTGHEEFRAAAIPVLRQAHASREHRTDLLTAALNSAVDRSRARMVERQWLRRLTAQEGVAAALQAQVLNLESEINYLRNQLERPERTETHLFNPLCI